jgi:anti-anti-sigma regulatory factor
MEDDLFHILLRKIDDQVAILDLHGRITGTDARKLEKHLLSLREVGFNWIILNFREVESIDTLGIQAISSAMDAGVRIRILHPDTDCSKTLRLGLKKTVELYHREEAALRDSGERGTVSQERRRHKRIEFNIPLPVEIRYRDNHVPGLLLNLSEDGALLGYLDPIPQPIPTTLRISFNRPHIGKVEFSGQTVSPRKRSDMHTLVIKLRRKS